jgi:glycine cleavage system H protein
VESVKAVSDLFAPVTGTVTEVNEDLANAPETINTAANTTWMIRVELTDALESAGLLSASEYEHFLSEETGH